MGAVLLTPPEEEPISLDEAKLWCKVDDTIGELEDALIQTLVTAARRACERFTRRSFVTQEWQATFGRFPARGEALRLPWGPVSAITAFDYYDADGADTALAEATYVLDLTGQLAKVHLAPDQIWPDTIRRPDAVRVTYEAGYGAAADVPGDIGQAILSCVGQWYDNREMAGQLSGAVREALAAQVVRSLA